MLMSANPQNNSSLKSLPFYHLDDCSFKIVLYEMSNGSVNFDIERLETLLFNPIDLTRCKSSFNSYLDPDSNFSFCPPESDYLVEEEINARILSKQHKPSFSILHLARKTDVKPYMMMKMITKSGKTCYVAGDYIILISYTLTQDFVDSLFSHVLISTHN